MTVFFLSARLASAATFQLGTASNTITVDSTFSIPVILDSQDKSITGADAVILYDPQALTFLTAHSTHFFPFLSHTQTPGSIRLSGVVTDLNNLKKGKGDMAALEFKALKTGQTNLHIVCDTAANETSKIVSADIDATNIISCGELADKQLRVSKDTFISSVTRFLRGWWK